MLTLPTQDELDKLREAAEAATPQNFDSAECGGASDGWIECPHCAGEGTVELTADYCNYDGAAMGVQFYGIGDEHGKAEAYYRLANPAQVLALLALIAAQQKQIAEQGWISVDDRFPPNNLGVLVSNGIIVTAAIWHAWSDGKSSWTGHEYSGHEWGFDFDTKLITHWKALPPPPEPA